MGVLEQVSQMRSQGMSEQEIVQNLKQQKVSPREINDALNQARIKDAVYGGQENYPSEQMPMPENIEAPYSPRTQDIKQQEYAPPPQEEYSPPQEFYQQETYSYPQTEMGQSSDIMIEVSEQVFNEKIKKVEKQIEKISDIQAVLQSQTEYSTERLKRIESVMDKLQIAILEKIGSYGKNLESIKKEMGMIEDSFTKIVPGIKRTTSAHKTSKKK